MKRFTLMILLAAFAMVPSGVRADISNMDIGGDLMLLFYFGENTDDFDDGSGEEVDFLRSEAHLWFQADLDDNVMVRISVEADREMDSMEPFNSNSLNASASDLDVFLEEAFIQIANIYDTSLSIMAGRQFLGFGDNAEAEDFNGYWGGSLWFGDGNPNSPQDIAQMGTWETDPFDGIVLEWDLDTAVIDAFYVQAVDDITNLDRDIGSWGINASYIGIEGHQIDGYFAYTDGDFSEVNNGEFEHFLVGLRFAGDILPEELAYKLEGAYNFGDIDNAALIPGLNTSGDGDFEGFILEAGLNYHPDMDYNPEIGFIYTWMEGDDNNTGVMDEDFDGIFLPFEDSGYGEIADSFVFTNCHVFHITAGCDFNDQWSLDTDWYYFLLDEDGADVTQLSLLPTRGWGAADDDELGIEWDIQLNYAFNESVAAFGGAGIFWPGDAIDEMEGGEDDEAYFIRTGVKVAF